MNDWLPTKLADLIEVKHGYAFKGEYIHEKPPGEILLTPGNFAIGGGFQWGKNKYYNGPIPDEYILRAGDLLTTMTDLSKAGDTLGYSALVPQSNRLLLHNQRLGKITIKNRCTTKEFVHWVMRSQEYRHEILASCTGSTVRHTSPTKILAYSFLLPPFAEQEGITRLLDSLEAKIELNRQMNETLEAMARAVFKDWFVDFGPTRAKMEGRPPYLSPEIWGLFPERLDTDGKPEGWILSTIGEEVTVVGGSTPSTKEPSFWNGNLAWATPKDFSSLTAPVLLETERKISESGLAQISSGLLPKGSVLLSSRAPIGYLAISMIPTAINQGFIGMICDKRISNVFVWLWTKANIDAIHQKANGSTFQEISKSNFRPISCLISSPKVLAQFDMTVTPLFDRICENEVESRLLAKTRDLLLPKLMSGEIRVGDAEKMVEGVV